jgi:bacterioferritin
MIAHGNAPGLDQNRRKRIRMGRIRPGRGQRLGPEGFELGEEVLGLLHDLGDLTGMGRARGDPSEAAPGPLQAADDAVQDGGIDHPFASVGEDPAVPVGAIGREGAPEYQAIVMYTQYSAKLTGPYRRELRALFQAEIADEQGHAQFLADKIAALGGEPTTEPRAVARADQPREMLEQVLAAERRAIADYDRRIHQAEAFGDVGLKVVLESQVADETRHKEELERVLAGWNER